MEVKLGAHSGKKRGTDINSKDNGANNEWDCNLEQLAAQQIAPCKVAYWKNQKIGCAYKVCPEQKNMVASCVYSSGCLLCVFDCGREDTNNKRNAVEWCDTFDGAAKQFRRE
ncbi:hypothetical protein TELCIR_18999 [Teladorsagia circumcincta]|uniref:Uncharacterized protein n=1 Tax=Teladorsagia circumcincta TaxID=45464 RepID=A0A2G9TNM6_TELCI|nr:hypothetical protein TELCIR_18999 [Teladorsagia circumcincta]